MAGIEPAPRTWNARVPPQHFIRIEPTERFELSTSSLRERHSGQLSYTGWGVRPDSNRRRLRHKEMCCRYTTDTARSGGIEPPSPTS